MEETRSTVIVQIRRHGNAKDIDCVLGRIPMVGEYIALDSTNLFEVTHVVHSDVQSSINRPATRMPDGSASSNDGRVLAVVYVNEVKSIDKLPFQTLTIFSPANSEAERLGRNSSNRPPEVRYRCSHHA